MSKEEIGQYPGRTENILRSDVVNAYLAGASDGFQSCCSQSLTRADMKTVRAEAEDYWDELVALREKDGGPK